MSTVVFSAWISLFLIQTLLIARGSRRLHQRLGWIGAGIAGAMIIGLGDIAKVSIVSTLLVDAFFLPCFAYDLLTRRRIHPVYVIALALIVMDQVAQATVVTWTPWVNFANALQRLVA